MQYPKIHPKKSSMILDNIQKELGRKIIESLELGCIFVGLKPVTYSPYWWNENTKIEVEFLIKPGTEEAIKEIWNES